MTLLLLFLLLFSHPSTALELFLPTPNFLSSEQKEDIHRKNEALEDMKKELDETKEAIASLKKKGEGLSIGKLMPGFESHPCLVVPTNSRIRLLSCQRLVLFASM